MKIGLVGQNLLIDKPAGVEKYIYYIFHNLAKIDKTNEYTVYLPKTPEESWWKTLTNSNEHFKYKVIPYSTKPFVSWTQMLLAQELYKNPIDVIFYPFDTISGLLNFFMPKQFNPVCMIHDFGYIKTKEYRNPIIRLIHFFTIYYVIVFSKKLIVPANSVKETALKMYPTFGDVLYKKDKMEVVVEGLNPYFTETNKPKGAKTIKELRNKYGIEDNPYLYFVSTIQPRKNIPIMIEAFSKVIKENPKHKDVQMVLTGKYGWHYNESLEAPKKFKIEDNVKFIGRTSDEEVATLMKNAQAFINISIEEGFGLPALEAMSCKTPMILSDIDVYKELARDYAIYVDPLNVENIKEGILAALEDNYPKNAIEMAKKLSEKYTWEKAAQKTLEVFTKTLNNTN
jgi:glycosyltransferase involved in cell wall biosynthesis